MGLLKMTAFPGVFIAEQSGQFTAVGSRHYARHGSVPPTRMPFTDIVPVTLRSHGDAGVFAGEPYLQRLVVAVWVTRFDLVEGGVEHHVSFDPGLLRLEPIGCPREQRSFPVSELIREAERSVNDRAQLTPPIVLLNRQDLRMQLVSAGDKRTQPPCAYEIDVMLAVFNDQAPGS